MEGNGQLLTHSEQVLHWPHRVLAAEDVRTRVNGHRELVLTPRTIITPLAAEQLRSKGVQITRHEEKPVPVSRPVWGYAQERPHPLVKSAVQALERDGQVLRELTGSGTLTSCRWASELAACVAEGRCHGGVIFCEDPGLVCCVGNKRAGLRAVSVTTVAQAARAALTLGPNLVAVEMPGRTYFEIRQILRILCEAPSLDCPNGLACTLKELESRAHR
jgi:hypothetical protein